MTIKPQDLQAIRIVIRALSDEELIVESKAMRKKASYAQGMADQLDREIKRRKQNAHKAAIDGEVAP